MIQRIQTIYLFVSAVLSVVALCMPVGHFYTDTAVSQLTVLSVIASDATVDYTPWPLCALLSVSALLPFVAIFLYKTRMKQIRVTAGGSVALLLSVLAGIIYVYSLSPAYGSFTPSWTVCLPLISLICNWIAIRGIRKDEKLVRSYNTIR